MSEIAIDAQVDGDVVKHFMQALRRTLQEVLELPPWESNRLAEEFEERLRHHGATAGLLHAGPLQVALDLTGKPLAEVTPERRRTYAKLAAQWLTDVRGADEPQVDTTLGQYPLRENLEADPPP